MNKIIFFVAGLLTATLLLSFIQIQSNKNKREQLSNWNRATIETSDTNWILPLPKSSNGWVCKITTEGILVKSTCVDDCALIICTAY